MPKISEDSLIMWCVILIAVWALVGLPLFYLPEQARPLITFKDVAFDTFGWSFAASLAGSLSVLGILLLCGKLSAGHLRANIRACFGWVESGDSP